MSSAAFNFTGANGAPGMPAPPTALFGMPTPSTPTGGAGNFNFGNTTNPNPPQAPVTHPSSPGATGGSINSFAPPAAPPSQNPGSTVSTTAPTSVVPPGSSTSSSINSIYGGGVGDLVSGFLNSEGGYNSALTNQTVAAQSAAAQQQITLGANNLKENLAASGISPDSSVSALEMSNYESQAATGENAIAAQEYFNMWGEADQLQAGTINNVAQAGATQKANSNNWWESILGDAATVGGDLGSAAIISAAL